MIELQPTKKTFKKSVDMRFSYGSFEPKSPYGFCIDKLALTKAFYILG